MRKINIKRTIICLLTLISLLAASLVSAAVLPPDDTAEAVFYATAEINKKEIKVTFSNAPAVTDYSSVAVYNTESGKKISTDEPVEMGMSIMISVKEELEKSVEYCVMLPENMKSKDGEGIYSPYVYFVSELDKDKAQELVLVNETFDNYPNNNSKQNIPENWMLRKQGTFNEFKFYSDDEHDKAFQLAINGYVPIVATRNFGKTLDKQFTIEFDYKQTAMNKFISGEEDPNLIQGMYEAVKALTPSLVSVEKLNLNMGFHLAPVEETGKERTDSKGNVLPTAAYLPNADWSYVSNDKIVYCTNFFQLYGDRLGFGSWTLPQEGNYVRINLNEWYHVVLEIDMESLQATGYIDGEKIGPYKLPDAYKDAQYGAVAARATFQMENPVKFNYKDGKVVYEDFETGEEKTYTKPNDSNFVIDNFRVITQAPEFKAMQTRAMSVDGEEFGPLTEVNSVINRLIVTFSSGVDADSVDGNNLKITDFDGKEYTYSVTGYDAQTNTLEISFDNILAKDKKYTVYINGILSDLGVSCAEYYTTFSLGKDGSIYTGDIKVTDVNGTEITGSVNAGSTVYFDGRMADSTNENNPVIFSVAAYKKSESGETMVGCVSREANIKGCEININATNEPLALTLAENADYVRAFVCAADGYNAADKAAKVSVSSEKLSVSGEAKTGEMVNVDIPQNSKEYKNNKNCEMLYRGATYADDKGTYNLDISSGGIDTGVYTAYVYNQSSGEVTECEFVYSTDEDILGAAAALNSAADKEKALADNRIKLGINNVIYNAGSNSRAAIILSNEEALSETDSQAVRDMLDKIYLVTAIDNGNTENLFDYSEVLDLKNTELSKWISKKYVTDSFEKNVTEGLENHKPESVDDFYDALTEEFILEVVALNDGYGNAEEIITAFEDEIGVDANDISESDYKRVSGKNYENYSALKKALMSGGSGAGTGSLGSGGSSGSGSGGSSGSGSGGGYSSGGGYVADTKLPPAADENAAALLYDIFEDIEDVIWAKPAIVYLAEHGIINGTSETTFSPNEPIKREEITKILVNTYIKDAPEGELPFADADKNEWYYPFISKAYNAGVVKGYDDTTFGVGEYVTRQDLAVMIYNVSIAAGEKYNLISDVTFDDDAEIADYAKTAVYTLKAENAINGVDGYNFEPQGRATRAEAAKIIYGLLEL